MSEFWQLSAAEIADGVRKKKMSALEVTQAHLDRLKSVNPALNAIVDEMPDEALVAARSVDKQVADGKEPGPLCGVPVTIKVTTDQKEHATTGGLAIQKNVIAEGDSPVVANIRKAGGIIVGRTATPAFSVRWFTKSNLYGLTLNPHDKSLTPGGSSGGASSAVASGMCAIGHGTDIAGSIRYPAYACGLQGLRPTIGRIPQFNAGPERPFGNQLMAVSGPIARTIRDIELSLQAMVAPDMRDPWWVPAPLKGEAFPKRVALTLAPDNMPVADDVKVALTEAARRLEKVGWCVEERSCPPMQSAADINAHLWMGDVRNGMEAMVEQEGDKDAQFVLQQMMKRSPALEIDGLLGALKTRASLIREWALFLEEYPVLLCPVSGQLPFSQQQDVESEEAFEAIMRAQLTQIAIPALGLPGLSVATGMVDKTPVGVQLVAGRYREDILLAAGADIERACELVTVIDPKD